MSLNSRIPCTIVFSVAAGLSAAVRAEEPAQVGTAPPRVIVQGSMTDLEAGRDFVAGKIIIGHKRIEESGLQNVGELLRREPAISVGKDGRIGLLGLPGYTQILLDGVAGKSPAELDLIHVEKIEIIKSAIAEYGPFGVAGTINIITRKLARKTSTRANVGASSAGGQPGAKLSWSHNESQVGSPFSFDVQVSASRSSTTETSLLLQTLRQEGQAEQVQWQGAVDATSDYTSIDLSSGLNWQFDARSKASFSPSAHAMRSVDESVEQRRWTNGDTLASHQVRRAPLQGLSLPLKWTVRPDQTSQIEVSWLSNLLRSTGQTERADTGNLQSATVRLTTRETDSVAHFFKLHYRFALPRGHDAKVGAELSRNRQDVDYAESIDGWRDASVAALGEGRRFRKFLVRLFAQDDWRINDAWAANAGVAAEKANMHLREGTIESDPDYQVWSPSLHVSRKLNGEAARQLRFSIARTFQAPYFDQLVLRPLIHPLAPCPALGLCAANTVDTADVAGNPLLKPERALGLNLSYEHGMGADSQLTVEAYARDIEQKQGSEIFLEQVSWASVPRYVARPANLGSARVRGLELDLQLALRDVWTAAPAIDVRASVALSRTTVASVPGPDNRLENDTPWRAKLGATYGVPGWPLKIAADVNWAPATWVRSNQSQRIFSDQKTSLSGNAQWKFSPRSNLVVNLSNAIDHDSRQIDAYLGDADQRRLYTNKRSHTKLAISLETRL